MLIQIIFLLSIIILLYLLFRWAFIRLPKENWQILGVIPSGHASDGSWEGINLTYYGFIIAGAYLFGTALVYILLGSLSFSAGITTLTLIVVCIASVPASKILAGIIEKKPHTASVGAASFVGIIIAPWAFISVVTFSSTWIYASNMVTPAIAAFIIAYAFGEGIGRLACISFGCCYGKPMADLPPFIKRIAAFPPLVFVGSTKKIAYADHMEKVETFPIQAVTAVLYCTTGVIATYLFLNGYYQAAFLLTLGITQIWRFFSEFLRADHRGNSKISVYQIMALLTVPYGILITILFPPSHHLTADLVKGFYLFKSPMLIIFLQVLWIAMFWYNGKSNVTRATLRFHVNYDRI